MISLPVSTYLQAVEGRGSGGRGSGVGPVVSTMAREDEEVVPDDQKTAFDWCKEGNVARLVAMVTELTINVKDEQVRFTEWVGLA